MKSKQYLLLTFWNSYRSQWNADLICYKINQTNQRTSLDVDTTNLILRTGVAQLQKQNDLIEGQTTHALGRGHLQEVWSANNTMTAHKILFCRSTFQFVSRLTTPSD